MIKFKIVVLGPYERVSIFFVFVVHQKRAPSQVQTYSFNNVSPSGDKIVALPLSKFTPPPIM
jgi:hypothetical protein